MAAGNRKNSVVVIGAGIAGIQAALDLANAGISVHLVELTPSIGGRMAQLDKTFPTNDCSICILAPKMSECGRHPNIILHPYSSLLSVAGKAGDFSVVIKEYGRYVDPNRCVSCGLCAEKCPVKVKDEFDMGLRERKAIYRYFLQSIPSTFVIDRDNCLYLKRGVCRLCEKVCPAQAIRFDDCDRTVTVDCCAIIVATGIDPFNPIGYGQYGYPEYEDVVTSIEFERMLSASGPNRGHLIRPSDGKEPKRIAFIQCVGSRDQKRNDYCSSVCCMYAMKQAIIAKEHDKEIETTIFYMDLRAFGKDFDKYYERAKSQFGVRFERGRVARIKKEDGRLMLYFTPDEGRPRREEFDLIVLSVGLVPRSTLKDLAETLAIRLDRHGFIKTRTFQPLATTRPGIFVCGGASGPKDIPESVMSASGSVVECFRYFDRKWPREVSKKTYPQERDIIGDRPRIGVFICHCGINIAGVVDVKKIVNFAKNLQYVEHAQDLTYACAQDSLNLIKAKIEELDLNRIVVAACTPRTHEPLFRETLREAGLNPYLFEMANIRDQCSWAHMEKPDEATEKAKDLVKMAVAKAQNLTPLQPLKIKINPKALVIGGGLAGMVASLAIGDAGYEVVLLEKERRLGGNLRRVYATLDGDDPQAFLKRIITRVTSHPKIRVIREAEIESITGYVGNYRTKVSGEEIEHGAIIVATGAVELKPEGYLYGKSRRVVTQLELERMIPELPRYRNVVMIQCVGSRDDEHPYCSRVCCQEAIKNALRIKELHPLTNIYILYRDIRTYGRMEEYYEKARNRGIIFIRYTPERRPQVYLKDGNDRYSTLLVKVFDPLLGDELILDADLLVLAPAIIPPEGNVKLARLLKVPLNREGFFLEAHLKLRPVDFATDGVFMCGLAHSPKNIEETIIQAKAAAARAITILSRESIDAEGTVSWVDPLRCQGCGYCVSVCAYAAVELKEREGRLVAEVNEAICKGCGVCAATCRSGAIDLKGFSDEQIFAMVTALRG